MTPRSLTRLTLVVSLILGVPAAHAAPVLSSFDTDLEGWIVTGDNA